MTSGAALKLNGINYSTAEALSINGTGVSNGGALANTGTSTYAGAITVATDASINMGGGTLNLTGGLIKNGTVLTLTGGGTVNIGTVGISGTNGASHNSDLIVDGTTANMNVANTYDGPTYLRNAGTINATVANALPTANGRSAIIMDDTGSGSSILALTNADQAVASLTGASTSTIALNNRTLTVGTSSGTTTFAGTITGATGSLIKDGASTQILSGVNSYTGSTSVTGGILSVNGSLSASSAVSVTGASSVLNGSGTVGAVTVGSGGTIGGTLTTGALALQSGGIVSPGNSPGTITASSATFLSGASYTLQMNNDGSTGSAGTNWDKIALTGNLDISSLTSGSTFGLTLQTLNGSDVLGSLTSFDPNTNHTWASVITTGGLTGSFASNLFTINTTDFQNSFTGSFNLVQNGNNLDLIYTAVVPEPGTWAMMVGGLAMLVVIQRRRSASLAKV